jgi:hypothetical protein
LLKANARELIEKAIEMAKNGDGPALRLCIDRLAPARKDRPVWFDLPKMNEARDAVNGDALPIWLPLRRADDKVANYQPVWIVSPKPFGFL